MLGTETFRQELVEREDPVVVCRQVMREFCVPKAFKVIVAKTADDYKVFTLDELLPESFGPEHLV